MNRSDRTGKAVYGALGAAVLAAVVSLFVVSAVIIPASAVRTAAAPPLGRGLGLVAAPAREVVPGAVPVPGSAATAVSGPLATGQPWQLVLTGHYGNLADASGYPAVIAPGRDSAWVFGGTNPGEPSKPVAEDWNGRRWHPVTLPAGLDSFISAASASGPANVWAVSAFGGYLLRWDGTAWSVARKWNPAAEATGVTAISPADVWLFGAPGRGVPGTGTWRFDGRSWTHVTGPDASIYRASAIRHDNIWGITAGPGGDVVHWNGHRWARVRTGGALAGTQPADVLATSARSVWVVASSPATAEDGHIVVAHWNGRAWHRMRASGVAIPRSLAGDGHGGIWITAMTLGSRTESRLLHLTAAGRWTQTVVSRGLGNAISDLARIPGTRSLWGSGGFLTASGGDAAIWLHQVTSRPRHPVAEAASHTS